MSDPAPPTTPAPTPETSETLLAVDVSEDVERLVALGLLSRAAIVERRAAHVAQEWVEEPEPRLVERELTAAERDAVVQEVDAALAQHVGEQAAWPTPTDPERLERAFATMAEAGILARQAYGIHEPDALSLLQEERADAPAARGYVFYDQQMLEETLSGRLRLSWGGFAASGEIGPGDRALGEAIAEALRSEGLEVFWDGSVDSYIELEELRWRVRRDPRTGDPLLDFSDDPSDEIASDGVAPE